MGGTVRCQLAREGATALRSGYSPNPSRIISTSERPIPLTHPLLLNRPDLPPAGAGENSIRPVAAALANAVFDASGVRPCRAPLTPEHLKPALA